MLGFIKTNVEYMLHVISSKREISLAEKLDKGKQQKIL